MDNNQQELESLILEKRKIDIPNLTSHPSYMENGDDAIVDFSVDDIYDCFKRNDVAIVRPVTKANKVVFECDEIINLVVDFVPEEKVEEKQEEPLQIEPESTPEPIEIIEVVEQVETQEPIVELKEEQEEVIKEPEPEPEKKIEFVPSEIPLLLFDGKLSDGEEAIYNNAFRSDSEITALEKRAQEKAPEVIEKEKPKEPEPVPDTPELAEVKAYLSTYPSNKIYRGIISEAEGQFIAKDAFVNADVLEEILGKSKEIAIEKAKKEAALELGKDAEDQDLFNYAKAPLASEEEITDLESKHMALYSSISRIQEIQSANDFKSAYQIQDRISYLLNHRTLLYKSLTQELIKFVDSITKRLDSYYEQAASKYAELKIYNEKISGIKNYKWRADESMKIIQENKESAQKELESL